MKSSCNNKQWMLLSTAVGLAFGFGAPAMAQSVAQKEAAAGGSDIVVTARRTEEKLQDVPISITVFNQKDLANNNVVTPRDLTIYTPSISANVRNGSTATYTIRGFTQDARTTPTVGIYFADVVAPRSGGTNPGGDTISAGQFFDLQNIQVLNGPQGTLFGRNTTGGAVLLVPRKPTNAFEGYVEASGGEYDMRRLQGVVNIPVNDSLRIRLGADSMKRDGYLKNISPLGPRDFGNIDYTSLRASVDWDITPSLENYTVLMGSQSATNGVIASVKSCNPAAALGGSPIGTFACAQVARLKAGDFWTVENSQSDAYNKDETWSLINTTTWKASDNLTIKNIISYAELKNSKIEDLYGSFWVLPPLTAVSQVVSTGQVGTFFPTRNLPGKSLNDQSTFTEELQALGDLFDGRLTWQAGLYYEKSEPNGPMGNQSTSFLTCGDAANFICTPKIGVTAGTTGPGSGTLGRSFYENTLETRAVYAQGSYDLTDQLKLTAGIRYTWDEMSSHFQNITINFPSPNNFVATCINPSANPPGVPYRTNVLTFAPNLDAACLQDKSTQSDDPTWLLDVDYKPIENILLYAKYARGYRQGGLSPAAGDGAYTYGPESVDNYEVGAKTSWKGMIPGTLNASYFYNDLTNQQLTVQLTSSTGTPSPTVAIANVGKSEISGFEVSGSISPFAGLDLTANYAKLDSEIKSVTAFTAPPPFNLVAALPPLGADLLFAVPEKYTLGINYTLPFPEEMGKISVGGAYVNQSTFTAFYTRNGKLPGYEVANINLNWEGIGGSNVDLGLFVTNVGNEQYYTHVNDQDNFTAAPATGSRGFISYYLGEPRMFGARLKYRFGG